MTHHFGEIHVEVEEFGEDAVSVMLTGQTGAKVMVSFPRTGMFTDPARPIENEREAEDVGRIIAHALRDQLA